jgi:hypothetical protein
MRSSLEQNRAEGINILSASLGTETKVLTDDFAITGEGPILNSFDPNGADRVVTLPGMRRGRWLIVSHEGSDDTITVEDLGGDVLKTLGFGEVCFFFCTGNRWVSTTGVFGPSGTGHSSGLVPDPGPTPNLVRFLADDGTWKSVTTEGIVDAYKQITDGVNTATASGLSQFKLRSANGGLEILVTEADATHGDNALLTVVPAAIDHDQLLNYVADQHVAHSSVAIATASGSGLAGGGDISTTRNLSLDIAGMSGATPALADSVAIYDNSATAHRKATLTAINAILDHDQLLNYSATRHVDHAAVSVTAGAGLQGGGTIEATRTISLDIHGQSLDTPVLSDEILFYDVSGADINKVTLTTLNGILDHNALLNYSANRHIDHSAVSITTAAGSGLQGGGTIAASRSLSLDINGLASATIDMANDYILIYDVSGAVAAKALASGITASIDINALSEDTTPDAANDFFPTYDASAGANKKVKLNTLKTALSLVVGTDIQAYNANLAAIAALSPSNNDTLQRISGAWTNRTPTQVRTTLGLVIGSDVQAYDAQLSSVMPQNAKTSSYTLVATDQAKHIYLSGSTSSQTITIPANTSVAFPLGTVIEIVNNSSRDWSIAITSDTLVFAPSGGTGTRTLASKGMATLLKVTSTGWFITGVGLS